jgi:hypothetical protein
MVKKKHKTPAHLDYLFERKVIKKAQYEDFWEGYWDNKRSRDKARYVDNFVSELQMELPMKKRGSGTVTISIEAAREQAKEIGGFVVRRNAQGRFSKTGKRYQAIARRKK